MTRTKKALIVVLSVLCVVCLGMFTLSACKKKEVVKLASISITHAPDKVLYIQGETFKPDGLKVEAKFTDDTTAELTADDYTLTVPEIKVSDDEFESSKVVKVSYTYGEGENEVTKTANQSITVTNLITSATVKTLPTTTEYYVGQPFNPAGMTIDAVLQDESKKTIEITSKNATFSPDGALGLNTEKVKVTIGGYDISVDVDMINAFYVEAENGYRNGAPIDQTTGDQGNLRTDSTTADAEKGAKALYESHLKAEFAVAELIKKGVNTTELAGEAATPDELSELFGGTKSVYSSDVTVGGEIISKLYVETVKWLKDSANKAAIDEYVASEKYESLVDAYIKGTNTDKATWNYENDVIKYTAHDGGTGQYYLGQNNQGNVISFLFDASVAGTGSVKFRLSSAYLYISDGWSPIAMADVHFNKLCEFYVNGVKQDIPADKLLYGGKSEDGATNGIVWVNWDEVNFDNVSFVEGRNVVELKILNHGITAQQSYNFAANIDSLLVTPGATSSTKLNLWSDTDLNITTTASNVSIANEGGKAVLTVAGTYSAKIGETAVKGYLGDKLSVTVGGNAATVVTNPANGTFTAKLDVTDYEVNDYAIQINGAAIEANPTGSVTIGHETYAFNTENGVAVSVTSDASLKFESIALQKDGNKVYLIYTGTYTTYTKAELEAMIIDMEGASGRKLMTIVDVAIDTKTVEEETVNTFTIKADISDIENFPATGFYYIHAGFKDQPNDLLAANAAIVKDSETVTVGNFKYTLGEQYNVRGVTIKDARAVDVTATDADILVDQDKVVYIVNGTYTQEVIDADFAKDAISKIALDFQMNCYAAAGTWDSPWDTIGLVDKFITVTVSTKTVEGKTVLTYQAMYDITELTNYHYTGHYNGGDFKPAEAMNKTVEFNGRTYNMVVFPDAGGDGAKFWGCVGLIIADKAAE